MDNMPGSLLQRNLSAMKERFAPLAQRIESLELSQAAYHAVPTPSGPPALGYLSPEGKKYLLCDKDNPVTEAESWLSSINLNEVAGAQVVLAGFGLGYHLLLFTGAMLHGTRLLCVEKDIELIGLACCNVDLSPLWNNPHFDLMVFEEAAFQRKQMLPHLHRAALRERGLSVIVFPAFEAVFPDWVSTLVIELDALVVRTGAEDVTRGGEAIAKAENTLANIILLNSPGVGRLFGRFTNVPAVVVSAGPSLSRNMHLLKDARDRVCIIAIDTAYRALAREGIHADLVVAIDYSELNYRHFEGLTDAGDSYLVVEPRVDSRIPVLYRERCFTFSSGTRSTGAECENPVLRWLIDRTEEKGELVGLATTSITALDLARLMGCTPVCMIGQDLALTGGASYAEGVMQREEGISTYLGQKIRTVEGTDGQVHQTTDNLFLFKRDMELYLHLAGMKAINATEGGAKIEGTIAMPLREFMDTHATESLGLPQRFAALRLPQPDVNWSGLKTELGSMAIQMENIAKLAAISLAAVAEHPGSATVASREINNLSQEQGAFALCQPLIRDEIARFEEIGGDAEKITGACSSLFQKMQSVAQQMAQCFKRAAEQEA
jgi:hypothetical protein